MQWYSLSWTDLRGRQSRSVQRRRLLSLLYSWLGPGIGGPGVQYCSVLFSIVQYFSASFGIALYCYVFVLFSVLLVRPWLEDFSPVDKLLLPHSHWRKARKTHFITLQAVNPEVQLEAGQDAVLTCSLLVPNVNRKSVVWRRDGEVVTEGISRSRFWYFIVFCRVPFLRWWSSFN